ncbi:CD166 antigen homolog A isoform X2 [Polypterus senegalus]|uniref:CD166 antigen homolog A isoform X2 n=1 Tax=Polypterus senegalus TaxID=55291 RepID=UPI0019642D89|nr:CD166 antigen homolog A isoform X2 [Polypterus senegalus]
MDARGLCFRLFVLLLPVLRVHGVQRVAAVYGETITIPCGSTVVPDLMFVKWKYEDQDGVSQSLLTKPAHKPSLNLENGPQYEGRLNITSNYSLLISGATLADEHKYVCMMATDSNVFENSVIVNVFKKPSKPEIINQPTNLEVGKLIKVGDCISKDSNPKGNTTWLKNGQPLIADETTILIKNSDTVDAKTGLSSTSSSLQYVATKADKGTLFSCQVQYFRENQLSDSVMLPVYYPAEKVQITMLTKGLIREGDNVTFKCSADGNPPPSSYTFFVKEKPEIIENSDLFSIVNVSRDNTGNYSCSLPNNNMLQDSTFLKVHYLDLTLKPQGLVTALVGTRLNISIVNESSTPITVTWMKDRRKITLPVLEKLQYEHAGLYECEVASTVVNGMKKISSFDLAVEGKPHITRVTKKLADDGISKVLSCYGEGLPPPNVRWNVNITSEKMIKEKNGKFTHQVVVFPQGNISATCIASNKLGEEQLSINISSLYSPDENSEDINRESPSKVNDQAKLIVGIVVGLLLAALVAGFVYWLYSKKSKQGSWKTGEKEMGTHEESKKLEESNHKSEA